MNPKMKLDGVTKKYTLFTSNSEKLKAMFLPKMQKENRDFYALRDISLEIFEGETIGIVGINGSGKSTISNILAGVIPPTEGTLDVNGETSLIAINVGLNNQLNGHENIEQKCLMHGFSKKEIERLLPSIEEFADIGDFIQQPVKNYSSGMKSRLGFAISAHTNPDILIVDEALSVGDKTFYQKCKDKIDEFKAEGKTIIFISHNIKEIKNISDRVLWLHNGEMRSFGDKEKVIEEYEAYIKFFNSLSKQEKKEHKEELKMQRSVAKVEQRESEEDGTALAPRGTGKKKHAKQKEQKKHSIVFFSQLVLYAALFIVAAYLVAVRPLFAADAEESSTVVESDNQPSTVDEEDTADYWVDYDEPVQAVIHSDDTSLYTSSEASTALMTLPFGTEISVLRENSDQGVVQIENEGDDLFIESNAFHLLEDAEEVERERIEEELVTNVGSLDEIESILAQPYEQVIQSVSFQTADEFGYGYYAYSDEQMLKINQQNELAAIILPMDGGSLVEETPFFIVDGEQFYFLWNEEREELLVAEF
ncbi:MULTISPECIES: teichoic acids export ABC transporter ATP-binding subunit TagH [Bacillaceae]|uniref:teichoic acids export ABC transporter ATP-binding subunit TagH n=1 Tax=Shouchella oshimensis TaxID=290588 RepID=UPI000995DDAC|nr:MULTISPECIES: teichoic acids export ABC transporter ATP-binding subunit TagH [Bacillaceae]